MLFLGEMFPNVHGSKEDKRRKRENTKQLKASAEGSGHGDAESHRAAWGQARGRKCSSFTSVFLSEIGDTFYPQTEHTGMIKAVVAHPGA